MSNHIYHAGIARADITPQVGMRMIGYAVREGVSHAIDEPLTVTALAIRGLDDNGAANTVIIMAADVAQLSLRFAGVVRKSCGDAVGIPPSNILINVNHTHSSPSTPDYNTHGPAEQLEMEREYGELFLGRCVQAGRESVAGLQPARLGVGWSECNGNINRRQKMPNGDVLLGEDPDGYRDGSVGVLRVDDLNGTPLAIAFRYSCHTVTLGPKTNMFSPDFIGPARKLIEDALGCPSMFLQGCAGNMNPASGIGQDSERDSTVQDEKRRLGHQLGGAVLQAAQSVRTHRKRGEPRLVQSVAVYWLYEYENLPIGGPGTLRVLESRMELPLTPFPAVAEVERERDEWAAKLLAAQQRGATEWEQGPLVRFNEWAAARLEAARRGPNPLTVSFPIQVIRLEGLTIAAIPFEPMAQTGMAIREMLGPDTFVFGYSNGMVSYLPTPEVSAEGGMEARLAYKMIFIPSELPGSWEPQVKAEVIRLATS